MNNQPIYWSREKRFVLYIIYSSVALQNRLRPNKKMCQCLDVLLPIHMNVKAFWGQKMHKFQTKTTKIQV